MRSVPRGIKVILSLCSFPPLLYSSALSAHLCCPLLHAPLPAISAAFTRLFLHSFIFMCCSAPPAGAVLIRYKAAVFLFYIFVCVREEVNSTRRSTCLCLFVRLNENHLTTLDWMSLFELVYTFFSKVLFDALSLKILYYQNDTAVALNSTSRAFVSR